MNLKPCPFCGNAVWVERETDCGITAYAVKCSDCCARAGWYYVEEKAIAAWNTRHND